MFWEQFIFWNSIHSRFSKLFSIKVEVCRHVRQCWESLVTSVINERGTQSGLWLLWSVVLGNFRTFCILYNNLELGEIVCHSRIYLWTKSVVFPFKWSNFDKTFAQCLALFVSFHFNFWMLYPVFFSDSVSLFRFYLNVFQSERFF